MREPSLLRPLAFAGLAGALHVPWALGMGPLVLGGSRASALFVLALVVLHPLVVAGLRRGARAAVAAAALGALVGAFSLAGGPGRAHVALFAAAVVALTRSAFIAPCPPGVAFLREGALGAVALVPPMMVFDEGAVDTAFAISWFWLVQAAAHHWPGLDAPAERRATSSSAAADPADTFDALLARVNEKLERLGKPSAPPPAR